MDRLGHLLDRKLPIIVNVKLFEQLSDFWVSKIWSLDLVDGVVKLLLVNGALSIFVGFSKPGESNFLDVLGISDGICHRNDAI